MFNKFVQSFLAVALLLSNSGLQMMGCVTDPEHQACHAVMAPAKDGHKGGHAGCKGHKAEPEKSKSQSKAPMSPLACLQACGAASASMHPDAQVQMALPRIGIALMPQQAAVFIPSSEPRSIFHPPA